MNPKIKTAIQEAIEQLQNLPEKDLEVNQLNFLLNVQKEINRLRGLYAKSLELEDAEENSIESEELTAVRNYLEPLELAPEGTPVAELARLAAIKITEKE